MSQKVLNISNISILTTEFTHDNFAEFYSENNTLLLDLFKERLLRFHEKILSANTFRKDILVSELDRKHKKWRKLKKYKKTSKYMAITWCSGYHSCATLFNKAWTQILRRFKCCSRRVGDWRWWGSLTMFPTGNKAKRLSSVNHTTKTIHHSSSYPGTASGFIDKTKVLTYKKTFPVSNRDSSKWFHTKGNYR